MATPAPSPRVVAAFGGTGAPVALGGGQGTSWRAGDVVLKPADLRPDELEWQACVLSAVECADVRVSVPLRTAAGAYVVDGWSAWRAVEGRHEERRWPEIVAVGERLHAALAGAARPPFLDRRTDGWAVGDRVAWGELDPAALPPVKHLHRLLAHLRPLDAESQLVHGDLTGNVLFHGELPPAVIDFSPYWRPGAFASAVVVADALVWEGADESLLGAVGHIPEFPQYLLRALVYRAVTDSLARLDQPSRADDDDPYLPAVELACRLAA